MPKRQWDEFDEQAEREGTACKNSNKKIGPYGKRIVKLQNNFTKAEIKIDNRIAKRYIIS